MDKFFSTANPKIEAFWLLIAATLFVVLATVLFGCHRLQKISLSRRICLALLIEYIFLVLASTVLSRVPKGIYQYELQVFWSYREIALGKTVYIWENILNIVLLMPIGFLLPVILKARNSYCITILVGFLTSFTIEILQLVMKRGLFEFDDMIHNTLGVIIGVMVHHVIGRIYSKWKGS